MNINGLKVLDVGCGDGGFVSVFGEAGAIAAGVEVKDFGWPKTDKVSYFVQDVTAPDATAKLGTNYDLIILRDVIEHIPLHKKKYFLKSLQNFAHSRTRLMVTFPPFYSPFGLHQQVFCTSILRKVPFLSCLPKPLLRIVLTSFRESAETREKLIEIQDCRMTIGKFMKLVHQLRFSIDKEKYFQVRPSHEIRYGWQMRETRMNNIPLLREVLILGTVYLLDVNSRQ